MIAEAPQGADKGSPDNRANGSGAWPKAPSNRRADATPQTKKERVISYFLTGKKAHRFQAETTFHCHCLHTSISSLEREHGLIFDREWQTVPCLRGQATTRVKAYWLRPERDNLTRARAVLGIREEATQ